MFRNRFYIFSFIVIMCVILTPTAIIASSSVCFPPHEGLPDLADPSQWGLPPAVDGYIEPDLAVTTPELETGWTRSGRITYAGDAGLPQMVFQGLKDNSADYLYLSFLVRFDTAYDTGDRIVMVFHPNAPVGSGNTPHANHRRIDITPLTANTGAGVSGDTPDPNDATTADAVPYVIRTNRAPQGELYYKYNTAANTWDSIPKIGNIQIKVRSWQPDFCVSAGVSCNSRNWSVEVKLPLKKTLAQTPSDPTGANWIDFSNNFGFYFNVIRLCSSPTCTSNLDFISSFQYTWPRADYASGRGLIVDPDTGPIPIEQHFTTAPLEADWPDWLGEGIVGAAVGAGSCRGVRFDNGVSGIGVINPSNPSGPLGTTVDANPGVTNTFGARIVNDGTGDANQISATFRIARWGVGPGSATDWPTIPATVNGLPAPAPDNKNPAGPVNLTLSGTPGANQELRVKWGLSAAERTAFGGFYGDRCLWVLLDSAADVYFSESSVRRNLRFINLSTKELPAVISGKRKHEYLHGEQHNFLMLVSQRLIASNKYNRFKVDPKKYYSRGGNEYVAAGNEYMAAKPKLPAAVDIERTLTGLEKTILDKYRKGKGKQVMYSWLIANNAFVRTNFTLTLDGIKHTVFDPAGGFGYVGEHEGKLDGTDYSISGDEDQVKEIKLQDDSKRRGIIDLGKAYNFKVAYNEELPVKTRLVAEEPCPPCACYDIQCLLKRDCNR